jgi:GAF domain-containing protein
MTAALDAAVAERDAALAREAALLEVLHAINASHGELALVFDAMLERAMHLCGATLGSLFVLDGDAFRSVAQRGVPAAYAALRAVTPLHRRHGTPLWRALTSRQTVHVLDLAADVGYLRNGDHALLHVAGARTAAIVPFLKDHAVLGFISIYRQEVSAFSPGQLTLLESFAAQAVIALENARLITEQSEALERQTATAEVLGVINANPGNLMPVFDAILEKAHSICGASKGALNTFDGEHLRAVATRGISAAFQRILREPRARVPGSPLNRLMNGESVYQIADCSTDTHLVARAAAELEGIHTILFVPLRRDGVLLGRAGGHRYGKCPAADGAA